MLISCSFLEFSLKPVEMNRLWFLFYIWNKIEIQPSFNIDGETGENLSDKATFLMVLRVLRLARIVRIAKLSRHSRNLNTLIKTMSTSLRELSFLMLFFIVSMVLYATFAYYCEQNAEATGVSYLFHTFLVIFEPMIDILNSRFWPKTRYFRPRSSIWEFLMVIFIHCELFLRSLHQFRHHSGGQLWPWQQSVMVICIL